MLSLNVSISLKLETLCLSVSMKKLVHAFITSRLDYCNLLLLLCCRNSLKILWLIQNASVRVLTGTRKRERYSPIMDTAIRSGWWELPMMESFSSSLTFFPLTVCLYTSLHSIISYSLLHLVSLPSTPTSCGR